MNGHGSVYTRSKQISKVLSIQNTSDFLQGYLYKIQADKQSVVYTKYKWLSTGVSMQDPIR